MRPPSGIRDAHQRLIESLEADTSLDARLRAHMVSIVRQDRREALGTPVLHRAARAAVLRLYLKTIAGDVDGLTAARLCGEMIRALRSLGMLKPAALNKRALFDPPRRAARRKGGQGVFRAPVADDGQVDEGQFKPAMVAALDEDEPAEDDNAAKAASEEA